MRAWARCLPLAVVAACAGSVPPPEPPPPTVTIQEPIVIEAGPETPPGQPPPAPPAVGRPAAKLLPVVLRVGLATDLEAVEIPCCAVEVIAEVAGRRLAVVERLRVEPAAAGVVPTSYRLQAAALKDELQARGLAARLEQLVGGPADVVFDAGADLYRVRVGRFVTRELAVAAQARLAAAGVQQSFVISEQTGPEVAAMRLVQGAKAARVEGRWLAFSSPGGDGIRVADGRYRGRILVYLNSRGTLNLINEVGFEDYLRGVVPKEMGPEVFDNLEALKAQTVAARTYTVRNLGEFAGEGYDICATPRCQVYGGMDVEHPLTDQAIRETAGEILLHEGELVDALYSSTCGGHTEDVEVVFPSKQADYLKGVPCLEAGVDRLAGDLERGAAFPAALTRRLLPPSVDGGPAALAGRLEHLALLAGLPTPDDRLESLERREVQRFVASLFDLVLDSRLFVAREDLAYLLDVRPADWSESDLRLAAYLMRSGLLAGEVDQPLSDDEIEETLFHLALFLRVLERREVRYLAAESGELRVRSGGQAESLPLPPRLATFRKRGNGIAAGPLALLPGDRLTIYLTAEGLVAVVQAVDVDGVSFDRTSNLSSWTRFRSDDQLAARVRTRYPGFELAGFELVSRGVSGRVGRLRLLGQAGGTVEVRGLQVRWTLDLPDTLFTVKRLRPRGREPGWLFSGRGWGHGVGLCQVGAYGMAVRGHDYHEILGHYYSRAVVERLRDDLARQPAGQ